MEWVKLYFPAKDAVHYGCIHWKKLCRIKMQLISQKKAHTFQIMSVLIQRAYTQQGQGLIISSIHWHCHHPLFLLLFSHLLLTAFFPFHTGQWTSSLQSLSFSVSFPLFALFSVCSITRLNNFVLGCSTSLFHFILHSDTLHGTLCLSIVFTCTSPNCWSHCPSNSTGKF